MQNEEHSRSGLGLLRYIWTEWISAFVILVLLLLTLIIGTGEMIHGQLLRMGERIYGDPATGMQYSFLRAEPKAPTCDANPNVDVLVQSQMQANAADEFADFLVLHLNQKYVMLCLLQNNNVLKHMNSMPLHKST